MNRGKGWKIRWREEWNVIVLSKFKLFHRILIENKTMRNNEG